VQPHPLVERVGGDVGGREPAGGARTAGEQAPRPVRQSSEQIDGQ
jgi:hypothetical protein